MTAQPQVDVVVIGAGAAGLTAAYELTRSGRSVTVLEATDSAGGTLRRRCVLGLPLDVGPESFATATGTVTHLIDDLGLSDQVVRPRAAPAWLRFAGGSAPIPAGGWLGIPGTPWAADVRRVIGWPGALRASADRWLPARIGRSRGSIGDLVRARLGSRVLTRLVEPVVGGVYSTPPDLLMVDGLPERARVSLQGHRSLMAAAAAIRGGTAAAGAPVAGLRGGMYSLVEALVQGIENAGGQLHFDNGVTALQKIDEGWLVEAGATSWTAAAVVLAAPPVIALELLGAVAAPSAGSVVLCTLVVDCPDLDAAPRGSGVLVAAGAAGIGAKALTHATAKWQWLAELAGPGRHVIRLSYGRVGDGSRPDHRAFPQLAINDANRLLGVRITRDQLRAVEVTPWDVPGLVAPQQIPRADRLLVTGAWVSGTGLAAVIGHARSGATALAAALAEPAQLSGRMNR